MSDDAKCNCQRCGQSIAFPTEIQGQDVACPHCGRETTLLIPQTLVRKATPDYPNPSPNMQTGEKSVAVSTIVCSYLLCVLIPIAGFFAGIYLMTKKEGGHGAACMAISILIGLIFLSMVLG